MGKVLQKIKNLKEVMFLLFILVLVYPFISFAEMREESVEITPFPHFGLYIQDVSKDSDDKSGIYTLRLGYNITKNIGIEEAFNLASSTTKMLHANVLYHFKTERSFNPFVIAGLGIVHSVPDGSNRSKFMGNFGVGLKYFFSKGVALRVDLSNIITDKYGIALTTGLVFVVNGNGIKPFIQSILLPPPPKPEPKSTPEKEPAEVSKAEAIAAEEATEPKPTVPAPEPIVKQEQPTLVQKEETTMIAEHVKIVLEDVNFDFDSSALTPVAKEILNKNIKVLKENLGIKVEIEGHTCAHGSEAYNMALGERRANAVKEYLVTEGISPQRLTTISYGETRLLMPEIPTPHNKYSEEAKANRRVHFNIISR